MIDMELKRRVRLVKRKGLIGTMVAAIVVIALVVALVVTYFVLQRFVVVNWQLFPRNQEVLDLRDQEISLSDYEVLAWRMPQTKIIWSVPFQGGFHSSEREEIVINNLNDDDVRAIGCMGGLKTIHAEACTDYPQLSKVYREYPDIDVFYFVQIGSEKYPAAANAIILRELPADQIERLTYLPDLQTIDAGGCRDREALDKLEQEHPEWTIVRTTTIGGNEIDPSATSMEVTGATANELIVGLAAMPDLKSIMIHDPKADSDVLQQLRSEYPNVKIRWDLTIFGNTIAEDAEEVDISNSPIDSVEMAKEIASKFPNLKKLIVDSTGIPHEEMAAYRDEVRDSYKVVWTIIFTANCKARTDDTYFMPTKQNEYYFKEENVHDLKYLEDVIVVDLGHHPIHTVDFLAYMPHLKYLILTNTQVKDISPVANCKELVYLEVDWIYIRDLSCLVGCTALEDLSIGDAQCPADDITQLPWLKHVMWRHSSGYTISRCREALPDTVVTNAAVFPDGKTWRNLQSYYDMRDILGMPYMR